jgi:hypothetical protein
MGPRDRLIGSSLRRSCISTVQAVTARSWPELQTDDGSANPRRDDCLLRGAPYASAARAGAVGHFVLESADGPYEPDGTPMLISKLDRVASCFS